MDELTPFIIGDREYVELYGLTVDVTGVNELKKFGTTYTIKHAAKAAKKADKKPAGKKIKVTAEQGVEPEYIETKIK
jgi:hypothetical protein